MGDHFLVEVLIELLGKKSQRAASPCFPKAWHEKEKWSRCMPQAEEAFQCIAQSVADSHRDLQESTVPLAAQRCGLDALAWLHTVTTSALRDGWITPSWSNRNSSHAWVCEASDDVSTRLSKQLANELSNHSSRVDLLNKCAWLTP